MQKDRIHGQESSEVLLYTHSRLNVKTTKTLQAASFV